jgi:hypothetical protein
VTGARIVAIRKALDMTMSDLAKCLGVEYVTVQRWERSGDHPRTSDPVTWTPTPPKGMARAVLTGIERAIDAAAGDPQQLGQIKVRLSLGIGALIYLGFTRP